MPALAVHLLLGDLLGCELRPMVQVFLLKLLFREQRLGVPVILEGLGRPLEILVCLRCKCCRQPVGAKEVSLLPILTEIISHFLNCIKLLVHDNLCIEAGRSSPFVGWRGAGHDKAPVVGGRMVGPERTLVTSEFGARTVFVGAVQCFLSNCAKDVLFNHGVCEFIIWDRNQHNVFAVHRGTSNWRDSRTLR